MADRTDSFIREVEEELRRERFARLWEHYGTYIIVAAVLLVAAVGGYKYWEYDRSSRAEAAGARYEAAARLAANGKAEEARKDFEALATASPDGYATLSRLQLAGASAEAGNTAEAVAAYETIANTGADPLLRDFATLQAAMLRLDAADWTEMQNRLNDLTHDNNPWRASARELLGLAAYKAGRLADARREFERLLGDKATPPSMVERTQLMLSMLTETEAAKGTAEEQRESPAPAK